MIGRGRICALALGAALAAGPYSQAADGLDELLVTARRHAERLDTLPLSVAVVGDPRLGGGAVHDLHSLALEVPGLGFESAWGGQFSAPVLRGQSQPSTAGDNVGVFVDEVYQAGRSAMDSLMLDLARIEVLRGPQNTLFGRSSFAGAIHYVPNLPARKVERSLTVELGTSDLLGMQGVLSGPLAHSGWLARLAAARRDAGGTLRSLSGERLGDDRRDALALTLMRPAEAGTHVPVRFSLRMNEGRSGHPASTALEGADYNCGARDPGSGLWSYFCGELPRVREVRITPGLPDSRTRSTQVALHIEKPLADVLLRSLGSYYLARGSSIRDFDGSDFGTLLGVCSILGSGCDASIPTNTVTRLVHPQVVMRSAPRTAQWSQELRIGRESGEAVRWSMGMAASGTWTINEAYFGADRGDLRADERLAALVAANPYRVGPLSQLNTALVPDSRREQLLQARMRTRELELSAFGLLDLPIAAAARARLELRATRQTQRYTSRVANYREARERLPALHFTSITPRLSVEHSFTDNLFAWASLARGSRSGGINTVPGLDDAERGYGPESNWTSEVGMSLRGDSLLEHWQASVYRIDWQDTQILGVAATPGISTLITRNTAGLRTRGVESSLRLRAGGWRARLALSITDPHFVKGSDDAGSRTFCGLTLQPPESDFCRYGPPRGDTNGSLNIVPWLDGNHAARTPLRSATLGLATPSFAISGWRLGADASLAAQDDVFDRPINGARYGARKLLGARLQGSRGNLSVTLWGSNLADQHYIRIAASRGGAFYPAQPRPMDLLHADGRRLGMTLHYAPPSSP